MRRKFKTIQQQVRFILTKVQGQKWIFKLFKVCCKTIHRIGFVSSGLSLYSSSALGSTKWTSRQRLIRVTFAHTDGVARAHRGSSKVLANWRAEVLLRLIVHKSSHTVTNRSSVEVLQGTKRSLIAIHVVLHLATINLSQEQQISKRFMNLSSL